MAEKSLFLEKVRKVYLAQIVKIRTLFNGLRADPELLYPRMLTDQFAPDHKWTNITQNNDSVVADIVSLDSSMPLKKRPSQATYTGNIPKISISRQKTESDITDVNMALSMGANEAEIARIMFDDDAFCVGGILKQLEVMFLKGLSTGIAAVDPNVNTGTVVRVSYGVQPNMQFGAAALWGSPEATPISDIVRVIKARKEEGLATKVLCMSSTAFNNILKSDEGKTFVANFMGNSIVAVSNGATVTNLATPTETRMREALLSEYKFSVMLIDSVFKAEKNGIRTNITPFEPNMVTFLESKNVGRLVYGRLAEETNPVNQVTYNKIGNYILLLKFSETNPLAEVTGAQAIAIPVLNGDTMSLLNTQEAQSLEADTEGDDTINIYEMSFTRATVVAAYLEVTGKTITANTKDATIINKINELNDEQEAQIKAILGV